MMKRNVLLSAAALVALAFLAGAALGLGAYIEAEQIRLTKDPIYAPDNIQFSALPTRFRGWERYENDDVIEGETLRTLGTENYLTRKFVQTDTDSPRDAKRFSLHMAYYTGTVDTVPHVPERCMVGAGWEIAESSKIVDVPISFENESGSVLIRDPDVDPAYGTVWLMRDPVTGRRVRMPLGVKDLKMNVTQFRYEDGRASMYAGYFFIANGETYPTANQVRINAYSLTNRYAFYAKVQFTSFDVETAEELGELAGSFLDDSFHDIMRLLPDWVEVEAGRYPDEASETR